MLQTEVVAMTNESYLMLSIFLHFWAQNLPQYKYGFGFVLVSFGTGFAEGLKTIGIVSTNKSALIY